jgi:hypothetical protein
MGLLMLVHITIDANKSNEKEYRGYLGTPNRDI